MISRHDIVYLFDAADANPNGDPDAGNLPRVDPESGHGLVSDVCLKRKVRNFVEIVRKDQPTFDIYVREKAVLIRSHQKAYEALDLDPKGNKGKRKGGGDDVERARQWMCRNFYDIRTFGAVMGLEVNCGQVRGPVQMSFARSIDRIVPCEHAITRMAVATEREAESQEGHNRTMARKFTVPYALYRCHCFVNPFLAEQTGFSEEDLELFLTALENAFQFDQSAARPPGSMAPRVLLIFKHASQLGNAPSHTLFDRLTTLPCDEKSLEEEKPARGFADYASRILFDGKPLESVITRGATKDLGGGVALIRRI